MPPQLQRTSDGVVSLSMAYKLEIRRGEALGTGVLQSSAGGSEGSTGYLCVLSTLLSLRLSLKVQHRVTEGNEGGSWAKAGSCCSPAALVRLKGSGFQVDLMPS